MSAYADDVTSSAESHPVLGAEYFEARAIAERYLAKFQEEHSKQLFDAIIKPVLDAVQESVWDSFRDHLLSDTECNVHGEMRSMVERTVIALLSGEKWASAKYIETQYSDGKKVREALAKLHSDTIKDGRIADLEAQVEDLEKRLRWYTER